MEALKLALALKVLTFNVAGIPIIHPGLPERLEAIGPALRDYDVVALQELWFDKDAETLRRLSGLPYYVRHERDIILGDGLALLSRYPIVETKRLVFSCRPSALRLYQGESVANKGVMFARLETPKGELDVYNTHVVANYGQSSPYRAFRLTQVFELAEFIRATSKDRPFILLGDLNTGPGERAYGVLKDLLGLNDACGGSCRIDHILLPRGRARTKGGPQFQDTGWSDHPAVAADLGWDTLRLRLNADKRDRTGALEDIETTLNNMLDLMSRRRRARSWIPVYGFLMGLRYDHQARNITYVRDRATSARLQEIN
jgi:endonuclease/exonuclease/phosphatase family metal-dependent hydrolase